jgi:opacity protein-like surface antigen
MRPFRLLLASLLIASPTLTEAGGAFLFKAGTVRLNDTSQLLDSAPRDLDDVSYSTLTLNLEARRKSGVAFGAEFITYRHDFTPPTSPEPGVARTRTLQFVGKKYFKVGGPLHPYLGAGIGGGHTEVTYPGFTDDEFTLVLQAVLGLEMRFENLSFVVEAKHLYHDIEGGGNEYDPSGTGFFAGMGFNW